MSRETLALIVMLNNYFHDLGVAVIFSTVMANLFLGRALVRLGPPGLFLAVAVFRRLSLVTRLSLAWVILGGIPRALAYQDFEWVEAAGDGQIVALVAKHVVLVAMVALALYTHFLLAREVDRLAR